MKEISFYLDDFGKYAWEELIDTFDDVDYKDSPSEIKMITLNANVIATY